MKWLVLLALVLAGCSAPGQGMAFVVNRTEGGQGGNQGKSYSYPVATLEQKAGQLTLSAGADAALQAANVTLQPGANIPLTGGKLRLEGQETTVNSGQLSLQTLQDGVWRGNFNARLGGGLEAVGYFEARLTQP